MAERNGTSMFPRAVMNRFPLLPLEEEGRINDMPLRENFIERVSPVASARQGLLSLDPNAGRGANARRLGPCPCGQGRQVLMVPRESGLEDRLRSGLWYNIILGGI
jgi:hypothetical protein